MFIYCNDCGWQQDDFWSEDYYPTRNYNVIENILLPGIRVKEKRQIKMPPPEADELDLPYDESSRDPATGLIDVDFRALVGIKLMRIAKTILAQYWVTYEDFMADIDKQCPICNSTDLGMD